MTDLIETIAAAMWNWPVKYGRKRVSFDQLDVEDQDVFRAQARAALAAIEASGYRVVPVEPTEEMVDRIGAELVRPNVYMGGTPPGAKLRARSAYAAMLAAAPKVTE